VVELLTVGHGTAAATELGTALAAAQVRALVDIRIAPGSRRSLHLARDRLSEWLPPYGVDYRWDRRLGGFRKLPLDSPDTALRSTSFRAYAAWTRDSEFATAIDELLAGAGPLARAPRCCAARPCGGAVTAGWSPTSSRSCEAAPCSTCSPAGCNRIG
jgi:hypothetical protein